MPLKLNVGVARTVGQAEFGSYSASCYVEMELDQALLQSDLDGFGRPLLPTNRPEVAGVGS